MYIYIYMYMYMYMYIYIYMYTYIYTGCIKKKGNQTLMCSRVLNI